LATYVFVIVIGAAALLAQVPPPDPPACCDDISGYYLVKGQEAGGKAYAGVAIIERKREIFLVTWTVDRQAIVGVGVQVGDRLSVGWSAGQLRGVNTYKIEHKAKGPVLTGRWATVPGPGVVQHETLTFLHQGEPEE
jgi:hypothetical protein